MAILDKVALKAALDADVDTNGAQGITGAILNNVLTSFIDSLSSALGARFHGFQEGNVVETDFSGTTPGDYESMAIVLIPSASNADFTVAGGVATYIGAATKEFIISCTVSGHKVGPGVANVAMRAFKNGTTPLNGRCVQQFLTGDPAGLGVTSEPVSLATNDTLQVKIANNTDQDNVLAGNVIVLINEWF